MLVITAVVVILAYIAYFTYYKRSNKDYWRKLSNIRGKPTLPIIGNIHQFSADLVRSFKIVHKIWEDCDFGTFKLLFGNVAYVFVSSPDCVETILKNEVHIEKVPDFALLKPIYGRGVFTLKGDEWRQRRGLLVQCFQPGMFEEYVRKFDHHSQVFVKKLGGLNERFDVYPMVQAFVLDSLCDTALGQTDGVQNDRQREFGAAMEKLGAITTKRTISLQKFNWWFMLSGGKRRQDECVHIVHKYIDEVIERRRQRINTRETFLDALLHSQMPIARSDIRDEVKTFIFAGHDTTSSAISFLAYNLSKNPQVQNNIFEEQRKIFGEDLYRSVGSSDLDEMRYLECCIKETLRLYPSVPAIGRTWNENTTLPDGTELPAGISITIFTYGLGCNPKYYSNPGQFDPHRFEDRLGVCKPFSFVPFSAGPRSCIGQKFAMLKIKTAMSTICRRYIFSHPGPEYEPQLCAAPALKSNNGIHLRAHPRNLFVPPTKY